MGPMKALLRLPHTPPASIANSSRAPYLRMSEQSCLLLFLALYNVVTPVYLQAHFAHVRSLSFTLCSVLTMEVGHNATRCPFAL